MADIHDHVVIEQALKQLGLVPDDGDVPPIIIGEANDGINVGDGEGEIYGGKTGVSLRFRTLKAGAGIIISTDEENDTVDIAATGTGAGDVEGTPPSYLDAFAIYYDTTGLKIKNSELRHKSSSTEVRVEGNDPNSPGNWLEMIKLSYVVPNGAPSGTKLVLGNTSEVTQILTLDSIYGPGNNKKVLWEGMPTTWALPKRGTITEENNDLLPPLELIQTGTNPGSSKIHIGNRNPEGNVTANQGALYIRSGDDNATLYVKRTGTGNTGWVATVGEVTASDILIEKIDSPTPDYDDVQDTINQFGLAGSSANNYISDSGGGDIDVAAGSGFIRVSDSHIAILKAFNWAAVVDQTIPTNTARYVGIIYNSGTPIVDIRTTDDFNGKNEFRLGSVVNEAGTLHILNDGQQASNSSGLTFERFFETLPYIRANRLGGIIPAETGTRNLTLSSGELYDGFNEFIIAALDTSGSDDFDYYYRDGGSGWTKQAAETQWNNTQYDNDSGTLQTLGTAKYGVHWLYIEADGDLVLLFGQDEYNNSTDASDAPVPDSVPLRIQTHGRLLGRIIFQKDASTAIAIENVWSEIFGFSGGAGGDVIGPSVVRNEDIAIYNGTTGKVIKDSTFRIQDVTNIHRIQVEDPNVGDTWLDAIKADYTAPNGAPSGTRIVVGNTSKPLVLLGTASQQIYSAMAGDKKVIHENMNAQWALPVGGSITESVADTFKVLELINSGSNPGESKIHLTNRNPEGNITADAGAIAIRDDGVNSALYFKSTGTGNTGWMEIPLGTDYLQNVVEDTSPQLGGTLDTNQQYIEHVENLTSDHTATGEISTVTVDVNAFGLFAALFQAVDGNWETALATNAAVTMPVRGFAIDTGTGSGKKILRKGYLRDDTWNWTLNLPIYPSPTTAGGLTQTRPDTVDGYQVQIVGWPVTADIMEVDINTTIVEVVI